MRVAIYSDVIDNLELSLAEQPINKNRPHTICWVGFAFCSPAVTLPLQQRRPWQPQDQSIPSTIQKSVVSLIMKTQ